MKLRTRSDEEMLKNVASACQASHAQAIKTPNYVANDTNKDEITQTNVTNKRQNNKKTDENKTHKQHNNSNKKKTTRQQTKNT